MVIQTPIRADGASARHDLPAGGLEVTITAETKTLGPLFKIAARQNPKRGFLFVSTVLGRHIPVDPRLHRQALAELAGKLSPLMGHGPALVMGYAETAVGLGAGVADELRKALPSQDILYLPTTRHPVGGRQWFGFSEGHSHATEHEVMRPDAHPVLIPGEGKTLVLVDDEATTGATLGGLSSQIFEQMPGHFSRILLATLTDWSDGKNVKTVKAMTGCDDVQAVSLMSGTWTWAPKDGVPAAKLPDGIPPVAPAWEPVYGRHRAFNTPRCGLDGDPGLDCEKLITQLLPEFAPEDRVLVIGSGEHVWSPFLFSEAVQPHVAETGFIATTRSPIVMSDVIRKKMIFPDHFGLGIEMYLHNVDPADWDRIVLFTETDAAGVTPELRHALGKGHIIDGRGIVTEMKEA
ncbi:MAG: phosphoribosyltransferase domain-containing protein [Roseibium sp.]|uniref:phosphoribosyltransferase domain-containing protein n=1 Tax=Roseibium sp. TaxID=1936156 RepID=UPI003297E2C8